MKTLFRSFLVVSISCFALFAQSCSESAVANPQDKTVQTETEWTSMNMNIEGMTCAIGCAKTIQHKLNETEGISDAKVDFENKLATVTYDKNNLSENDIIALVNNDIYTATVVAAKECKPGCEKACCVKAEAKDCKPGCEKACCAKADVKKCSKDAKACAKDSKKCSKDAKTCVKDSKKCSKDAKACAKDSKKCSKDAKACSTEHAKKCSSKDASKCSKTAASTDSEATKCEKDCTKACCAKS